MACSPKGWFWTTCPARTFSHVARLKPAYGAEFGMIEEMCASFWRLRRTWAIETRLLQDGIDTQTATNSLDRIAASFRQAACSPYLALMHRYESRLRAMYQRAIHTFILLRNAGLPNERQ
jgi:hypothetical protein